MTESPLAADLPRRFAAEALGSALLAAAIIGSGIMAERLAGGNAAIALLANAMASATILIVLIAILAPISGAHFNPLVSLYSFWQRRLAGRDCLAYILAQILGGMGGAMLAHAMFDLPLFEISQRNRGGLGIAIGEGVAAFGLLLTIQAGAQTTPDRIAARIGLYILGAYWFTSSTAFANPAIAIARSLTNTFAGIRPADLPVFFLAEFLGMAAAIGFWRYAVPQSPARRRKMRDGR